MSAHVVVIITAWNEVEKTAACLETAVVQTHPHFTLLLVDNGSDPPLAPLIQPRFPQVEIVRNPRNLGFAGGYNVGLRRALAQGAAYCFLLNNDTLLAPDCLAELVEEAQRAPDVGLVTAKIYYAGEPQRIWSVGNRLHPWLLEKRAGGDDDLDRGQWDAARDVDFAPFCGALLTFAAATQIGLLDEQFFLYYEDLDYCLRLRAGGWRLRCAPRAQIWHAVSSSSGGVGSPAERYWKAQSSGRYFRKHGRGARMLLIFPYRLASALRATLRLLAARRGRALRAYWLGLYRGWRSGIATTPPPPWVSRPTPPAPGQRRR